MKFRYLLFVAMFMVQAALALAQDGILSHREFRALELRQPGPGSEGKLQDTVRAVDAPWLRLHIGGYNLGKHSYVSLTSLLDRGQQRLDARTLPQWGKATAYFNGDAVAVELHIAPGETGIFVRFDALTVGERPQPGQHKLASICGTDNRAISHDPRVGRINLSSASGFISSPSCTAWLVSNGAVLTAGHCVDTDPDGNGPLLPDGLVDAAFLSSVVEFDVPASNADGSTVFANPNSQYPIDATRIVWRFDGAGQGFGKDWAVFACLPNPNTRLLPHHVRGFFRMTDENPEEDANVTVTGFGTASGVLNQTLQAHTGPFQEMDSDGDDIWIQYRVDTMPGNSGGPVIRADNGLTIGIHTTGSCTPSGSGSGNIGTSFRVAALENALRNFSGPSPVHVDYFHPVPAKDGSVFRPFKQVTDGVNAAPEGSTVNIVEGTYSDRLIINRRMTLRATGGKVTIGQ